VLVWMYVHLALTEERDALAEFGRAYEAYCERTPRFIPRWSSGASKASSH
jgi:protein-S-isoprenylcysteine O-methyltransferase Ste14